ncbi:MAG TPA: ABC transporter ATP-binding protein, partial [Bdellovibrionota bacterium]|nr:ABC transporter ATP-binding protein [Bdellovibrionota bacterium]
LLSIKGHQYTLDVLEDAREAPAASGEPTSQPLPFDREINFDAVSYRYPDGSGETLNQISLTIQKGECVGIVGPSGSGKTTILNLLLGFLRPTSGRILIDRTELTPDRHGAWYRLIGYVQQEVFLLEGTLRENIVFGVPSDQVDIGRLNDVIRLASLEEFIGSLPQSVDTPVGERGATLSVGQKQRIGIARALYSGAQILIFDEATSALDPGTEAEITESIRQLSLEGYTVIIVAHRVTTLRHTQRIIELKKGALSHETTYGAISRQL